MPDNSDSTMEDRKKTLYIGTSYAMDFLVKFLKTKTEILCHVQSCVKFAVDFTLHYCMVLILKNIKRTEIMRTLTLKKRN